ncbi:hypothetical protein BaRGS_00026410 [Batillaria attramentaria]|uniref:Major facilitator superfamily (MFS) profile domain-containing protein n=1 Tax=Batillaria attramentaria TaxID=370345 RepID=A0ABD0K4X8_9CAEN
MDWSSIRWLFVPLCFLLYTLVQGVVYSMGIYYDVLRRHFDSSNMEISWLTSVLFACVDASGPLVSTFIVKFGCRRSAMLGALMAAVSIFVSTFSPNLPTLILTFGLFGGVGLSFMAVPPIVKVGRYFHRRRGQVTGLVCSGGGIGSLVFPPMLNYFLLTYGWKGSLWILTGIVLNGVCLGYACRVVKLKMTPIQSQAKPDNETGCGFEQEFEKNEVFQPNDTDQNKTRVTEGDAKMCPSDSAIKPEHGENTDDNMEQVFTISKDFSVQKRGPKKSQQLALSIQNQQPAGSKSNVCSGFDLSLLKRPCFLVYSLSVFLWTAGLYIPSTFIPPLAHTLGIDPTNAALLVSVMGIANIVSRVIVGILSDQPWADNFVINGLAAMVAGVATSVVPLLKTYSLLAAYCAVFGFCTGSLVIMRSPICVELLGVHKLTHAFGLVCFAHGLGSLIGAPLTGFLADATGDYSVSFHVIGGVVGLAGVVCLPLRQILRWEERRVQQ